MGGTAHLTGTIVTSVPGDFIEGMWDEVQLLAQKTPMLAPVFYVLLAALFLADAMLPIYLLKKLLHPVYAFIVAPLWSSARRATAALTSMGKGVQKHFLDRLDHVATSFTRRIEEPVPAQTWAVRRHPSGKSVYLTTLYWIAKKGRLPEKISSLLPGDSNSAKYWRPLRPG